MQEFEKKEAEYKKSENIAHTEYNSLCKQLGITGYSTARCELMDKVKELPEIYQKVAEKTNSLNKVVEFYSAFVEFIFGQQYNNDCVSMIKYVIGTFAKSLFQECIITFDVRQMLEACMIDCYIVFYRKRKHNDI